MDIRYILFIPIYIISINFIIHAVSICRSKTASDIAYSYYAKTTKPDLDHKYKFRICKTGNLYRCYILKVPNFRNRDTSNYMPHYLVDGERRYICWTGRIKSRAEAKTLCKNWGNATQQFIDSGIPAPGFRRQEEYS